MSRSYPCIGGRNRLPYAPVCCICGRVATWRIDVRVSIFRGDDEVRDTCDEHRTASVDELLRAQTPPAPGRGGRR